MDTSPASRGLDRRQFTRAAGALAAALAAGLPPALARPEPASSRVRVGVVGLGRGLDHVRTFLRVPNVELVAVCDADSRRVAAARDLAVKEGASPRGEADFRRLLEEPDLDAVSIAMPNFWHAPATILACAAGKHVYVEKPGSHNAREGELMVAAARKHDRRVQMGNQRRSQPEIQEAIVKLHSGTIGKVRFARCWYDARRGGIGHGRPVPVPEWLDYTRWQGPVPERVYLDNLVHYQWHWRWHWGGGELANNGVHALDIARWGLDARFPLRVAVTGGRYHHDDDQETPDTTLASFDLGSSGITWDSSSCLPRRHENHAFVAFYGEEGVLAMDGGAGYRIHDLDGREVSAVAGRLDDRHHFANFVEAIRGDVPLNSEIAEAQISTRWCHLGNIAYRTRTQLSVDAVTGRIVRPTREMEQLWSREYRPGWEPKV
ncbi:MAG: Gfo/Idh/MocA family oxidoreductase [Verrucomicrobiae bacterium]|nr:Gfo/Idh/MocA family oxidoreductase [Verrucomicrobiae bacterium]